MKKTAIFLIAIFGLAANVKAQTSKFYLKGGFNLANISYQKDGTIDDARSLPSFHAGLMADLPIAGFLLSLQPGIQFSGKGAKFEAGNSNDATYFRSTTNPYYVEVPLNLVVNLPLIDKESKIFLGAGGYAGVGVAGKNKVDGKVFGVGFESEDKIDWSNDDPTTGPEEGAGIGKMKRFDYGLNATAGFAFHNLLLSVNYSHGLAKINSGSDDNADDKNKNRVLSLSVGISL